MNLKIVAIDEMIVKSSYLQAQWALMQLMNRVSEQDHKLGEVDYMMERIETIQKYFELFSLFKYREEKKK